MKLIVKEIIQSCETPPDINGCEVQISVGQKTVVEGIAMDYPDSVASGNPPLPSPSRPWPALN